MKQGLTQRQADCLLIIQEHLAATGIPPSFDEIKDAIGLRSKSGIFRLINALVERGYLIRLRNRARSIALVDSDDALDLLGLRPGWVVITHPNVPDHVWVPEDNQMYPLAWFAK